ncbi:MAG: electron transport complex subunit RsxG [Halopseudomonas sp.]
MSTMTNQTDAPQAEPPKKTKLFSLGYPGVLLGVAVLLSTSLLALGHLATKDAIAERQAEDLKASLGQVLPAALHDNDLLQAPLDLLDAAGKTLRIYRAERQQAITAVAFGITAADGYGGPIKMIMGVDHQGQVLGVRVLSHAETPGLGDKIEIAKSDWMRSLDGHSLLNLNNKGWAVKKDGGQFDQFTGATITPRAVINAVKAGLLLYRQQQATLLTKPVEPASQPTANGASS